MYNRTSALPFMLAPVSASIHNPTYAMCQLQSDVQCLMRLHKKEQSNEHGERGLQQESRSAWLQPKTYDVEGGVAF